jgi:hypothetical protein
MRRPALNSRNRYFRNMSTDNFQAVTFFCEDVRPEVAGSESLIGVLSDNVNVADFPMIFPKIAVYTRVTFDIDYDPEEISIFLHANGKEDAIGVIDIDLISKAIHDAKANGSPISTIISRAIAAPFPIEKSGRILVYLRTSKKEMITGTMNLEKQH